MLRKTLANWEKLNSSPFSRLWQLNQYFHHPIVGSIFRAFRLNLTEINCGKSISAIQEFVREIIEVLPKIEQFSLQQNRQ